MNCDCKDWKESWHQIESAQVMASIHGQQYIGAQFKYCPWCGKELVLEYKPYEWKTGLPDYKWEKITTSGGIKAITNGRNTSAVEDKALSRYIRGKYKDVPTSSNKFADRKDK